MHAITALIGTPAAMAGVVAAAGCPPPIELPQGLAIVALGEQQIDRLTALAPGEYLPGFIYLSDGLQRALAMLTGGFVIAYMETEYFGGAGSQAAATFEDGSMAMHLATPDNHGPITRDFPINTALRAMGVSADGDRDEFDTIGLMRFRNNESLGVIWEDD